MKYIAIENFNIFMRYINKKYFINEKSLFLCA